MWCPPVQQATEDNLPTFFWLPLYIMKSKLKLRQKCLENRNIAFNKKGNDCLKEKDILLLIILHVKRSLLFSPFGIVIE